MTEKIKDIGWGTLGIVFMVLMFAVFAFLVKGGVWFFENYYDLLGTINKWASILIFVLLLLSVVPTIRVYTGVGIYYVTSVWGAIFWLFCLFVTYQLWGVLGVFVGLIMAGIGIFATAFLALLFDGQISGAFLAALNLALIYGIRMLGYWIASKHKETTLQSSDATPTPRA